MGETAAPGWLRTERMRPRGSALWAVSYLLIGSLSVTDYAGITSCVAGRVGRFPGAVLPLALVLLLIVIVAVVVSARKTVAFGATGNAPRFDVLALAVFGASVFAAWARVFDPPAVGVLAAVFLICLAAGTVSLVRSALPAGGDRSGLRSDGAYRDNRWNAVTNAMIAAIAVLLVTLSAELAFRLVTHANPGRRASAYGTRYDFVLSPYLMFAEPGLRDGGKLNSQGFEGLLLSPRKTSRELRIAVIGGSAAWSGGRTRSIAAFLENNLRESLPDRDVTVVNFGRQSYVSAQELILLQRQVLPLSFDLVVVYDGFNDIWVPYKAEPLGVGVPFLYSNLKQIVDRRSILDLRAINDYLATKSAIFSYAAGKAKERNGPNTDFAIAKCVSEYRRNLFQMAVLAKAYGTEVVFATQPFVGCKPRRTDRENAFLSRADREAMKGFYDKIVETAKSVAVETGARYAPTIDVFRDEGAEMFYDAVHIDPDRGNPAVAKRLAGEILRPHLRKQAAPPRRRGAADKPLSAALVAHVPLAEILDQRPLHDAVGRHVLLPAEGGEHLDDLGQKLEGDALPPVGPLPVLSGLTHQSPLDSPPRAPAW